MTFAVIGHHEIIKPSLAPSVETVSAAGTSPAPQNPSKGAIVQETTQSCQAPFGASHCCSKSQIGSKDEHQSLVLWELSEKELLPCRVLRPVWHSLVLVYTQLCAMGRWTMARSSYAQETKPVKATQQGQQRKGKGKIQGQRVCWSTRPYTLAILLLGYAILGCQPPRDGAEDSGKRAIQTSRGCNLRFAGTLEESWARSKSRSGIVLGQMSWQWASSDQASQSETGGIWENRCQVESRDCPVVGKLAEVPKESGRRISDPEAEIHGEAEATTRRIGKSRRGVCSCQGGTPGCSDFVKFLAKKAKWALRPNMQRLHLQAFHLPKLHHSKVHHRNASRKWSKSKTTL